MATKKKSTVKDSALTKDFIAKLKTVGIEGVKTESEARERMIAFLKRNEIEDCEDDSMEDLFSMVDAMYDDSDEQLDDAAEEIDDEEEEEDEESEDEFEDMEMSELKSYIKKNKLDVTITKKMDEDDVREAIREAIEEAQAAEVEKANNRKQKTTEKKNGAKPEKKETKKAEKKPKATAGSKRLNPLTNEDDAKKYDGLKKALKGKGDFEFNFIANGGVSVKVVGKNSKKVFFSFDSPKVTKEGEILGRVYLSSVRDEEVLIALFGEDIELKKSWSGNVLIIDISLDDVVEAIKTNWDEFEGVINKLVKKDEKMGKNRQKLEEDLKSSRKKQAEAAKSKVKKATKPAEDEEEEEEDEKPTKKASKTSKTTKPAVKSKKK